jgi:uncharacterized protein (TIGR02145 family)
MLISLLKRKHRFPSIIGCSEKMEDEMNKGFLFAIASAFCVMLLTACSDGYESTGIPIEPPLDLSLVNFVEPCKTDSTDTCEYGTLTDSRDGQTYKTVKIGDQWWMAENLNLETPNSSCWGNNPEKCEVYGRFYTWSAVMDSAAVWSGAGLNCGYGHVCSPVYPVYGLCPAGWRVPTYNEWRTLFGAVGGVQNAIYLYHTDNAGKKLMSSGNWLYFKGTDSYGFNVIPTGYNDSEAYLNEYRATFFWTSSEANLYDAHVVELRELIDDVKIVIWKKDMGLSVRCIKD